jgi:hypothetical protein
MTLIKPAGFYAFKAFPDNVYRTLQALKSSSKIPAVRNSKSGILGTVAGGSMTGSGARSATGGTQGDAYSYYVHHTASSIEGINELMDLALVSTIY